MESPVADGWVDQSPLCLRKCDISPIWAAQWRPHTVQTKVPNADGPAFLFWRLSIAALTLELPEPSIWRFWHFFRSFLPTRYRYGAEILWLFVPSWSTYIVIIFNVGVTWFLRWRTNHLELSKPSFLRHSQFAMKFFDNYLPGTQYSQEFHNF